MPMLLDYIWHWFISIGGRRQSGFGISPLTNVELLAWSTNYRVKLQPWEIDLIFELDDIFIEVMSKDK